MSKPTRSQLVAYRIGRGEQGVFSSDLPYTYYKSELLPYWRFATVTTAEESSQKLWAKFLQYYDEQDFVGMDMARKYIQMGMTRAKRYANYKGGKKYSVSAAKGKVQKTRGLEHEGKAEKEEASAIFREVWTRCREHEGYLDLKKWFLEEQAKWEDENGQESETSGRAKKSNIKKEEDKHDLP